MPAAAQWPRAERLDARRMTGAIQSAAGVALQVEGPCPGGRVGAAYVPWPEGPRSVLPWRPGTRLADLRDGPLAVIEALRPAGYPAPAAELAVQAGDAVALVWELLPGSPLSHLTPELLAEALALNDLQAGRLAGHPAIRPAPRVRPLPLRPPAPSPPPAPAPARPRRRARPAPAPGHCPAGPPPSAPALPAAPAAATPSTAPTSPATSSPATATSPASSTG